MDSDPKKQGDLVDDELIEHLETLGGLCEQMERECKAAARAGEGGARVSSERAEHGMDEQLRIAGKMIEQYRYLNARCHDLGNHNLIVAICGELNPIVKAAASVALARVAATRAHRAQG